MEDMTVHVGILYIDLFIPASQSLKDKRQVIKSLKDRARSQFNVSVAELDGQDKWQTATLGFAMLGNDNRYVDAALQSILSFVESNGRAEVTGSRMEFC